MQWLPQGQPFPSIFNPVYPHVNYRGIAVGSAGAPWYFYNPSAISYASYPQTVQVSSADVKDASANTGAAGSTRTRRQIQLRYGGRRGRSLNAEMIEPETSPDTQWKSVDSAPSRTKRQIQLRYGGRRGRSLNEMVEPETDGRDYESVTLNDPSRAKRQIQLRYRSGYGGNRRGRSLNEPVQFELDRAKRQILLRYRSSARRRHGRSLDTLWTTA